MINKQEFLSEIKNYFTKGYDKIEEIRYKNSVYVARIYLNNETFIAKYFENLADTREIKNYKLLQKLKIKTPKVNYLGQNLIIMQDIDSLEGYRIANETDQNNIQFLKDIANWYRDLHIKGKNINLNEIEYSEYDYITKENIQKLKPYLLDSIFKTLTENVDKIIALSKNFEYTLVYNDFYYDNAIFSPEGSFMFDYNLLGKGCIASDIDNVITCLGKEAGAQFVEFYGKENIPKEENNIIFILNSLSALIMANEKETLPNYATAIIDTINSRNFDEIFNKIIKK